jgi:hypothetical protein
MERVKEERRMRRCNFKQVGMKSPHGEGDLSERREVLSWGQ